MPTNKRYRTKPRREKYLGLTAELKRVLLYGRGFFDNLNHVSEEVIQQAWEQHGSNLMAAWIAEHPGSRPFAWWKFEAVPEHGERRIVDLRFTPDLRAGWIKYGILSTHTVPPIQEAESEYLDRHDLLTKEERHLLGN